VRFERFKPLIDGDPTVKRVLEEAHIQGLGAHIGH